MKAEQTVVPQRSDLAFIDHICSRRTFLVHTIIKKYTYTVHILVNCYKSVVFEKLLRIQTLTSCMYAPRCLWHVT